MKTKPKPEPKRKKKYRLNWAQIYQRLITARKLADQEQVTARMAMIHELDDAIDAFKERMYS